MSSRPILQPTSVITNGDMSQATLTSLVTVLTNISTLSYAYSWTGSSPVGTLQVQVSNDYSQYPDGTTNNAGTWTTLTLSVNGVPSNTINVSGSPGTAFADIDVTGAYAIRTVYTKSSGTGTLQAVFKGKVS